MAKSPSVQSGKPPAVQGKQSVVLSDEMNDLFDLAGAGTESVRKEDLLMPRLTILQALSPQLNERKPEFIDGAKQGQIIDAATNKLVGLAPHNRCLVLPVAYQRRHLEWKPRSAGGGLVHDWGMDDSILLKCTPQEKGPPKTPDGNDLVVAGTWYCLLLSEGARACFLAMASTQLKASRRWMTIATSERLTHPVHGPFQPPLFYRSYELTTVPQSNDQGDWFGWHIEPSRSLPELEQDPDSALPPALMNEAKKFAGAVSTGTVMARAEAFGEAAIETQSDQDTF